MVLQKKMENSVSSMIPESKEARFNVQRIDWMKVSIATVIIIAVILGSYMLLAKSASASPLKTGDSADMAFKFIVDGKTIVENSSTFKVGSIGSQFGMDSSKIDDAMIGKKNGDSVTIKFNSSEAYGEYDPSLIEIMNRVEKSNRTLIKPRTTLIPEAAFSQSFNEAPVLNKIYTAPQGYPFDLKVTVINSSGVTISDEVAVGKIIPQSEIIYFKVIKVSNEEITMELTLNSENATIQSTDYNVTLTYYTDKDYLYTRVTPGFEAVIPTETSMGIVKFFNDTSIVVDTNNPYAGKEVELTLKVLDIKSSKTITLGSDADAIKGAPTLDVFVMSYCPYGLQIEKGVIPAYELLKGKANFKIRFVSYVLHGQKETDENNRQICIREETKQFWPYLQCFVDKGQGSESACMKESGIDESKITDCISNRAADYMAVDAALNTQYGVQGSPTNVLDGKEVQIYPRSGQDVLNAVCNAFTTKPSECSTVLNSENPTAGFGFGTTTNTDQASC